MWIRHLRNTLGGLLGLLLLSTLALGLGALFRSLGRPDTTASPPLPTLWAGKYALSMSEAYQLAMKEIREWDKSARLYAMTSVDVDRPAEYDGTTGRLPHWNVDFVGSSNTLYHIEIREGKIVQVTKQGTASYEEGLPLEVGFVDSPELARLALDKGLVPYLGKWARGLNFIFISKGGSHSIIVRGASQNGRPAFLTFDARDGTLLAGAERSFTGGGLYALPVQGSLAGNVTKGVIEPLFPRTGPIADNIPTIAVAPNTTSGGNAVIYAGTDTRRDASFTERVQLLVSRDGGVTWHSLDGPFSTADAILHIKVTPDGSTLFVGTTEGLFYAQGVSTDALISWYTPGEGLPKGHITSLALSPSFREDQTVWISVGKPTTGNSLWAVPGSEGLFRSTDGGRSWERVASAPANVSDIMPSPDYLSNHTLFVISDKVGVFRSSDNGNTWMHLPLQEPDPTQIAVSPNFAADRTLFVAGMHGLWRSEDAGEKWVLLTKGMTYPENAAINVHISPGYGQDQTVVYGAFRGGLAISHDHGETWERIDLMDLGDPTPRAIAFLDEETLIFSTYPLLGWKPLYEQP